MPSILLIRHALASFGTLISSNEHAHLEEAGASLLSYR
jgi:hypothetical protein